MTLDTASFEYSLKQIYTNDKVIDMVYKDNPALALMSKMETFGGDNLPIPVIYGNPQGRSKTFASALANQTDSKGIKFLLERVPDYAIAQFSNEVMLASKGNSYAFLEAAKLQMDGAIQSLSNAHAVDLFRDGSGVRGQIASGQATPTIVLSNPEDVVNFEVGMTLQTSTAISGGTVKAGSVVLIGVDRSNGTLTASGNWTAGIATAAANDYIFVHGDYGSKCSGFSAWIPESAPTSSPFFGVDRTSDVTRLGGLRKNISAQPIEEGLIDGARLVAREGGNPDTVFMSFNRYAQLEKALGSKVQYVDVMANANIGFRGLQIQGPKAPIKVIPDRNCQDDTAWMLQMDTWKVYSLGKLCQIINGDGNSMLRVSNDDAYQVRFASYFNVGCRAPGYNIRLKLA
jgi:hypothetical protein